jgi:YVTN family beta-propeller protein/VCBS repeat-containing protein
MPRKAIPYRWLGTGAITFGMGVALANGIGAAHADDSHSSASSGTTASAHAAKTSAKPTANTHSSAARSTPTAKSSGLTARPNSTRRSPQVTENISATTELNTASGVASSADHPTPTAPAAESVLMFAAALRPETDDRSSSKASGTAGTTIGEPPAAAATAASTAATTPVGPIAPITISMPAGVAVSPDGTRLYVTSGYYGDSVVVINTATNAVVKRIAVGQHSQGVAVSPDGGRVYVANGNDDSVSVIDTATNTVTNTIAVGDNPVRVAVSPDGSRVYVANWNSNTVSAINTATNAVTTIAVGNTPQDLAVSPDGTRVYVANYYGNTVSVINTATNAVTATVSVGKVPTGVAVSPDGTRVYVGSWGDDSVSVISTATNAVTTKIAVGDSPSAVAISPDGKRVYVANENANSVSVINTATSAVTNSFAAGSGNQLPAVAVSPDGKRVYVANWSSNQVVVLETTGASVALSAPNATTGAITGKFTVVNPAGAKLTFTATTPAKGKITINKTTGALTYTPTAAARHAASARTATAADMTDTFTVTMTSSLGDTVTLPITVTISPKNTAPSSAKAKIGAPDATTGAVSVTVTAADADKDSLSFSTAGALKGSVVMGANGSFTYTPTEQARLDAGAANASTAVKTDAFTVTISDAHGGTTNLAVSVKITPITLAPSAQTLFANMHGSDVISAQLVLGSDKKTKRMVVYVSGINLDSPDLAASFSAVAFGDVNPGISTFIDTMYDEWKPTEIMLVGFSGGGIQVQNYAATGNNKAAVTTIVTYGSPLSKTLSDLGVQAGSKKSALAIVDKGDKLINWSQSAAWSSYDASNTDKGAIAWTDTKLPGTQLGNDLGVGNHDGPTYVQAAKSFDTLVKTAGSALKSINKDIQRFAGTVLDESHTTITY